MPNIFDFEKPSFFLVVCHLFVCLLRLVTLILFSLVVCTCAMYSNNFYHLPDFVTVCCFVLLRRWVRRTEWVAFMVLLLAVFRVLYNTTSKNVKALSTARVARVGKKQNRKHRRNTRYCVHDMYQYQPW